MCFIRADKLTSPLPPSRNPMLLSSSFTSSPYGGHTTGSSPAMAAAVRLDTPGSLSTPTSLRLPLAAIAVCPLYVQCIWNCVGWKGTSLTHHRLTSSTGNISNRFPRLPTRSLKCCVDTMRREGRCGPSGVLYIYRTRRQNRMVS